MSENGKTNIVVMWTVSPENVAEGDRIFESHAKWITGHSREGDEALLSYRTQKVRNCRTRWTPTPTRPATRSSS